jgi:hypothetical protein
MGLGVSKEKAMKNSKEFPVIETISKQVEAKELSPFELKKKYLFEKVEGIQHIYYVEDSLDDILKGEINRLNDAISKFPHKAEILTKALNKTQIEYKLAEQTRNVIISRNNYTYESNTILKSVLKEDYENQEALLDKLIEEYFENPPAYE